MLLVPQICFQLEGLPLAIELAAARIKMLSPHGLLERLEGRLTILEGGARDLPTHQRSLYLIEYEQHVDAARARSDEAAFSGAWGAGESMSLEEAVAYALGETQL